MSEILRNWMQMEQNVDKIKQIKTKSQMYLKKFSHSCVRIVNQNQQNVRTLRTLACLFFLIIFFPPKTSKKVV